MPVNMNWPPMEEPRCWRPPCDTPNQPVWEQGVIFVTLLVAGVFLSVLLPALVPAVLSVTMLALRAIAIWSNFMLWTVHRLDLSLTLILLFIVLLGVVNMNYGFLSERRSRKAIKGMFDQYVPPAHIDEMLHNPDAYTFAGESREMTVLFAEIRDFITVSESLTATELKQLLNEFVTPVTGVIFEHNGTVDKYVGDMVVAFWGAPLQDKNHRYNGVNAALHILDAVENYATNSSPKVFQKSRLVSVLTAE